MSYFIHVEKLYTLQDLKSESPYQTFLEFCKFRNQTP